MDKNGTNKNKKRNRQHRPTGSYNIDMAEHRGVKRRNDAHNVSGRPRAQRGPVVGVDMAAQRGVSRVQSGSGRIQGGIDITGSRGKSNSAKSSAKAQTSGKRKPQSAPVAHQNGRTVDVAEARRRSGNVDVMTGKPYDGRVRVPVDKRKQNGAAHRHNQMDISAERRGNRQRIPEENSNEQVRRKQSRTQESDREKNRRDKKRAAEKKKRLKEKKKQERAEAKRLKAEMRKPTPEEIARKKKAKEAKKKQRQERMKKLAVVGKVMVKVLAVLVVICLAALIYIRMCYKLSNIEVSGTDHYTDKEMVDIVTNGKDYGNTLLFLFESRINPPENVTFIDKIDVSYVDRNSVKITVYEKAMAGCIEVNGQYAYFDNEGIVLDVSDEKLDGVPCIENLTSETCEKGSRLSVGDDEFFQEILTITQQIAKSNIEIDKITYDDNQNLILHKGSIKIKLGSADNIEEKFVNLENMLEKLDGKKGTLDLSNYTGNTGNAIFKENK